MRRCAPKLVSLWRVVAQFGSLPVELVGPGGAACTRQARQSIKNAPYRSVGRSFTNSGRKLPTFKPLFVNLATISAFVPGFGPVLSYGRARNPNPDPAVGPEGVPGKPEKA